MKKSNNDAAILIGIVTLFVWMAFFGLWCKNHDTNPILFLAACVIKLWEMVF